MGFKPVTHILFDMDGLLLNTEDLYTLGFKEMAERYGKEFSYEFNLKLKGRPIRDSAEDVIKELKLPMNADEYLDELFEYMDTLYPKAELMPGVEKLIRHLHTHKIPLGLATSSGKDKYDKKVQKFLELFSLIPYKTFGSGNPDVKRGKPYPDIFLLAASKFPDKPKPEKCLVFEDSLSGVRAGRAAGMQVVMIPDPRLDKSFTTEATLVLRSMEDFRPEDFGLPPFKEKTRRS